MEKTCSEKLASFVQRISYSDLPVDVTLMAKKCMLDWFGCVFAAWKEDAVRKILAVARSYGGNKEATIVPSLERSSSPLSSFVNGAATHALEIDDVHRGSVTHPACVVIPAVVAVGEREGVDGRRLIEAVVSGYEITIRVGEAVGRSHYLVWHNTATCGTYGAAAGVGKVLEFSEKQYVDALGNAGSQSAGLWEFLEDGADTKFMHAGKAAMNGIIAADLAQKEFSGASKIFEGKRGFFVATSKDYDSAKLVEGIDNKDPNYRILSDSFKFYPCCRHTHSSIDATLSLASSHSIEPKDVESIDVYTYAEAFELCGGGIIKSPYQAKFHIPFIVATALIFRKVWLESFSESRIRDREILNLIERVNVHKDKNLDSFYPSKWPSRVVIHLKEKRNVEKIVHTPKGDPDNPLTNDEMKWKCHENLKERLTEESIERLITKIDELEKLDHVSELFADISFL